MFHSMLSTCSVRVQLLEFTARADAVLTISRLAASKHCSHHGYVVILSGVGPVLAHNWLVLLALQLKTR